MSNLRGAASRWLSFLFPHVERPLSRVFREDRLLFWATVALSVAGVIPLFLTPFLPFSDLGNTVAHASLMWDVARHGGAEEYFRINWVPTPYFTVYTLLAVVGWIVNPLFAGKFVTAIILILVPLGVMRLLVTLGRSPRLGLWAFLLGYDHNLFAGWVSFLVGIGLSLFVIAWTIEARTFREALRVVLYTAIVGLTHVQAVWLLMVAVPLTFPFGRPLRKRFLIHFVSGWGLIITIVPWLVSRLGKQGGAPIASAFSFEWHRPDYKISQFFAYTLDNFTRLSSTRLTALAFLLLTLGPLCLSLLPRRSAGDRTATPLVLVVGALGLYAFLWMTIDGPVTHWYTYPRYAYVTLLFLLLIPTARFDGRWAVALLPGVLAVLALDWEVGRQMLAFRKKTQPMLQVIAAVKPRSSVLPLVFDDAVADAELKLPPYHQLTSYIAAYHKAFMPDMWDYPGLPVEYRDEKRKPWHGWSDAGMRGFTMDAYGKHYDYVVVQGFDLADPLWPLQNGPSPRPKLVLEAGRWRLYEMQR